MKDRTTCPLCLGAPQQTRVVSCDSYGCPLCDEKGQVFMELAVEYRLTGLMQTAERNAYVRKRLTELCVQRQTGGRSDQARVPHCTKCGCPSKKDHKNGWMICSSRSCRHRFRGVVEWPLKVLDLSPPEQLKRRTRIYLDNRRKVAIEIERAFAWNRGDGSLDP